MTAMNWSKPQQGRKLAGPRLATEAFVKRYTTSQHLLRLKYPTACTRCSKSVAASQKAWWSKGSTRCRQCGPMPLK